MRKQQLVDTRARLNLSLAYSFSCLCVREWHFFVLLVLCSCVHVLGNGAKSIRVAETQWKVAGQARGADTADQSEPICYQTRRGASNGASTSDYRYVDGPDQKLRCRGRTDAQMSTLLWYYRYGKRRVRARASQVRDVYGAAW